MKQINLIILLDFLLRFMLILDISLERASKIVQKNSIKWQMMIEKIYKKLKEKIDREPSKDDYSKLIAVYEKPEYLFQEVLDLEGIEFGIEIEFESEMSENDIIKCLEKNGFPLEKMISKACSRNKKKNYQKWNFCRECCRNKDESLKCEKELISPIFLAKNTIKI